MRIFTIIRRNMALFLNNKMNILLSFASIGVVFGLYVFFLRDFVIDLMTQNKIQPNLVAEFTDRLMLSGLLPVINTTTCFGVIQISVNDAAVGSKRDYLTAPISPFTLTLGYWISSCLISGFFTTLSLCGCEVFFKLQYGSCLPFVDFLKMLGIVAISSAINSAILLLFAKGLKSTTTFSTFANLYGTLIGFLAGSYLPYHFYPEWLKPILFWFPPAQAVSVSREFSLDYLKPILFSSNNSELSTSLFKDMGVFLQRNGKIFATSQQIPFLFFSIGILIIGLCVFPIKIKRSGLSK